ncbi:hypothetical protein U1Q18_022257 [Sarracenia purpurea var. burkii]
MSNSFRKALNVGMEQLVATVTPRIRPVLDTVATISYELSEAEYADKEVSDPWVQRLLHSVESNVAWLQPLMTANNYDSFVHLVIEFIVKRLEVIMMQKTFSQLGGLQLDRDSRALVSHSSSLTQRTVRDKFARLTQMATILNLEKVSDILDFWGENSGSMTWSLTPAEVRRVLGLREVFSPDIKLVSGKAASALPALRYIRQSDCGPSGLTVEHAVAHLSRFFNFCNVRLFSDHEVLVASQVPLRLSRYAALFAPVLFVHLIVTASARLGYCWSDGGTLAGASFAVASDLVRAKNNLPGIRDGAKWGRVGAAAPTDLNIVTEAETWIKDAGESLKWTEYEENNDDSGDGEMESGMVEEEDEYGSSVHEEDCVNGNSENPPSQPLTQEVSRESIN